MEMIKTCPQCCGTFKAEPSGVKYCSKECYIRDKTLPRKEIICANPNCGKVLVVPINDTWTKHCSKPCQSRQVELVCKTCGRTFSVQLSEVPFRVTCSRKCAFRLRVTEKRTANHGRVKPEKERRKIAEGVSKYYKLYPEKHNHYKDGTYSSWYGENWRQCRLEVRQRDGYKCRVCSIPESDYGMELAVHHIKPFREFNTPDEANVPENLVSLCQSCHMRVEWGGLPIPSLIPQLPAIVLAT